MDAEPTDPGQYYFKGMMCHEYGEIDIHEFTLSEVFFNNKTQRLNMRVLEPYHCASALFNFSGLWMTEDEMLIGKQIVAMFPPTGE